MLFLRFFNVQAHFSQFGFSVTAHNIVLAKCRAKVKVVIVAIFRRRCFSIQLFFVS